MPVIPLVLKMEADGKLLMIRFSWEPSPTGSIGPLVVADAVRYEVIPAPTSWPE